MPTNKQLHHFFLTMGDIGASGGEGHCKEEHILVQSNYPLENVVKAFKQAEVQYNLHLSLECEDTVYYDD